MTQKAFSAQVDVDHTTGRGSQWSTRVVAVVIGLSMTACVATARNPAPKALRPTPDHEISLYRFWGDEPPPNTHGLTNQLVVQRRASGLVGPPNFLALSGGGSDGAFGAGLLVGWSQNGTRPQFDLVTGISTGALIAPFAFLGRDYDAALTTAFTTLTAQDFVRNDVVGALLGSSLAIGDSDPFRRTIARFVDDRMLADIAAEHARGRRLLIGTTDLDAQRPVIWDIGALAASDVPGRLEIIREIFRASASIPGLFEPVQLYIRTAGSKFDELHVDGGVTNQVFLYPAGQAAERVTRGGTLYIVRNAKVVPQYAPVEGSIPAIAERSIAALIKSQGLGDLSRLYLAAKRDGLNYRLAVVPETFDAPYDGEFDPDYMRPLFALGYELGREGYPWAKRPPGMD